MVVQPPTGMDSYYLVLFVLLGYGVSVNTLGELGRVIKRGEC